VADLDNWRSTMEVNLFGTLQLTQAVVPVPQGAGRQPHHHDQQPERPGGRRDLRRLLGLEGALAMATRTLARELGATASGSTASTPAYIWGKSVEWYINHLAEERGVDFQVVYDEFADKNCLKYLRRRRRSRAPSCSSPRRWPRP